MAERSDQKSTTTQNNMKSSTAFLVYTFALSGEPAFILASDEGSLHWLSASLRELPSTRHFTIGNGLPIFSDEKCIIEVMVDRRGADTRITLVSAGKFCWSMPPDRAERYAELIDGMVKFPGACHQYLEAAEANVPVFLVSKDEYDVAALREMRDD